MDSEPLAPPEKDDFASQPLDDPYEDNLDSEKALVVHSGTPSSAAHAEHEPKERVHRKNWDSLVDNLRWIEGKKRAQISMTLSVTFEDDHDNEHFDVTCRVRPFTTTSGGRGGLKVTRDTIRDLVTACHEDDQEEFYDEYSALKEHVEHTVKDIKDREESQRIEAETMRLKKRAQRLENKVHRIDRRRTKRESVERETPLALPSKQSKEEQEVVEPDNKKRKRGWFSSLLESVTERS